MAKKCAVLFSGGLDSSLAVCKMIEQGYDIELLHFDQGALLSNNLPSIRMAEIQKAYPSSRINIHYINASGIFRRLALTTLESDIIKHNVSLICMGCKLAMHVCATIFCVRNNISTIADGSTKRQERYAEQRMIAIDFIKALYNQYGITYINPIYYLEKSEIKYGLFDRGLTIQAMEDTCLFSHTFSTASNSAIAEYIDSKQSICHELIERGIAYEKNR